MSNKFLKTEFWLQILRIHLSSEDDLFFLHTLEVSEEEFQGLKVEQGILVDFANFPGKIISLLEKCIAAKTEDPPRYHHICGFLNCTGFLFTVHVVLIFGASHRFQAVLVSRTGDSLFKIVETNDFKQLPHIALAFRPGNDTAVKQVSSVHLFPCASFTLPSFSALCRLHQRSVDIDCPLLVCSSWLSGSQK